MQILGEFWQYMRIRKKWWLTPILLVLILFSFLVILAQSTAVAPFIYALF